MYVNKKFMLLVAFIELQKLVNWAQILFNNLHSRLQDLSMVVKLKKNHEETKFDAAQVIDIILCNLFPIGPTFQIPKSNDEGEEEDNSSTKLNIDGKKKGPKTSYQAKFIDFDSPP